ncbi:MAG TPA: hypothetical protein VHO23_03475 [Candidatus Paceibacterota bacterium]|nr:hypothetical protein [Candidatus Paceibacterota bacterium]
MSIPDHIASGKAAVRRVPADILLIAVFILATVAAFGLGMLAGREMGREGDGGIWIEDLQAGAEGQPAAAANALAPAPVLPDAPRAATEGRYVASKSGTKYYLPWCGTVSRIKEENKVWFATKEEAAARGYEPAANCPRI